jgi:hypothetical protein
MIVNYVNPQKQGSVDPQDLGMSYYQDHDEQHEQGRGRGRGIPGRVCGRPGRVCGCGRGRGGRYRHGFPELQQGQDENEDEENYQLECEQEQEHVGQGVSSPHPYVRPPELCTPQLESGTMSEDSPQSTVKETINAHVAFNVLAAEQLVLEHHTLPELLLDSCSTIDIVSNANLLHDIHRTNNPIWVRCNAGQIQLTHQDYLGDYPYPIWYNPDGVANILSLGNVSNNYQVTMDTSWSKWMTVHMHNESKIHFTPISHGLYKHELGTDESIQDMWTMLSTVSDSALTYTKRAYKQALIARKLQNIVMRPSRWSYNTWGTALSLRLIWPSKGNSTLSLPQVDCSVNIG